MKKEHSTISAVPEKRLFWAIISDYNFKTSLCELIDNAHDQWVKQGRKEALTVGIDIDVSRQIIRVSDTAGGVREEQLRNLVSPGSSSSSPDENQIGIFGVGTKRAVVALAEEIKIMSRFGNRDSFEIDISREWLDDSSWDMPVYRIEQISPGTTIVDLTKLRTPLSDADLDEVRSHFSYTYALLLADDGFDLKVNGQSIAPLKFDNWAFPPDFEPRKFVMDMKTSDKQVVSVEIVGGLVNEVEPGSEDYGVYFYCNKRLVAMELRDKEVGYLSGYAGIPHSDASLSRVIVSLNGAARHMPWNTSKSALNYAHPTFKALRDFLVKTVTQYSMLSRRLKGNWEESVFAHRVGTIKTVLVNNPGEIKKAILPDLPKANRSKLDSQLRLNKKAVENQPWVLGILEALVEVDFVRNRNYQTKNRIALILLDSTLEIGLVVFTKVCPV